VVCPVVDPVNSTHGSPVGPCRMTTRAHSSADQRGLSPVGWAALPITPFLTPIGQPSSDSVAGVLPPDRLGPRAVLRSQSSRRVPDQRGRERAGIFKMMETSGIGRSIPYADMSAGPTCSRITPAAIRARSVIRQTAQAGVFSTRLRLTMMRRPNVVAGRRPPSDGRRVADTNWSLPRL
jgi:hypothetical protein